MKPEIKKKLEELLKLHLYTIVRNQLACFYNIPPIEVIDEEVYTCIKNRKVTDCNIVVSDIIVSIENGEQKYSITSWLQNIDNPQNTYYSYCITL